MSKASYGDRDVKRVSVDLDLTAHAVSDLLPRARKALHVSSGAPRLNSAAHFTGSPGGCRLEFGVLASCANRPDLP